MVGSGEMIPFDENYAKKQVLNPRQTSGGSALRCCCRDLKRKDSGVGSDVWRLRDVEKEEAIYMANGEGLPKPGAWMHSSFRSIHINLNRAKADRGIRRRPNI